MDIRINQQVTDKMPTDNASGVSYSLMPEGFYEAVISEVSTNVYGKDRQYMSLTPIFRISVDGQIYEISRQSFVVGELLPDLSGFVQGERGFIWDGSSGARGLLYAIGALAEDGTLNLEPSKFIGMPVRIKVEHAAYFVTESQDAIKRATARAKSREVEQSWKARKFFNSEHVSAAVQQWNAENQGDLVCKAKNFVAGVYRSDNEGYTAPDGLIYVDEAAYRLAGGVAKAGKPKKNSF